jgi:glycosyltransferase involved in cell wall biosynthesis
MNMTRYTLYLSYFSLHEPLVQTQVIPYLKEIARDGVKVILLTFEKDLRRRWTKERIMKEAERLSGEGIEWHWLRYHKRFAVLATSYDIVKGTILVRRLISRGEVDIIHARAHVPALIGSIARRLFVRKRPKLLFDIRGFFPEEYVDAGIWREGGVTYRTAKFVEKWLLKEADGFVVLTEKAREILFPESKATGFDRLGRPVQVIPCCVDLGRFAAVSEKVREEMRKKLNVDDKKVIAYVGSFGGWYLTEQMIDFFSVAREFYRNAFILILTQRDKERVIEKLRNRGLDGRDCLVESLPPQEIPTFLSIADVALSFIKPCYSKLSSSPTKIAEYLASGVPVVTNSGIGDIAELITEDEVGVVIESFDSSSYKKALERLEELRKKGDLSANCRKSAKLRFDLINVGGERYRALYKRLLGER